MEDKREDLRLDSRGRVRSDVPCWNLVISLDFACREPAQRDEFDAAAKCLVGGMGGRGEDIGASG